MLYNQLNGFNLLQEKNTRNEYIFQKFFKLSYLRVIKHEIDVILPTVGDFLRYWAKAYSAVGWRVGHGLLFQQDLAKELVFVQTQHQKYRK